ncbi:MAG TPA: hypothetical protein VF627_07310 [Abditibacterium sp.]
MSVSRVFSRLLPGLLAAVLWCLLGASASAQAFRFTLRAEPDVIPANGISTASIFVQVPQGTGGIQVAPIVRFATTAGVIESQAQLSGGVARVLLRSATAPGTAVVTAFIGNSREALTVEFSEDTGITQRYLEVAAPYVAYGADASLITASGKAGLDFGDTHIESDVRLDVDLGTERVWAQGTKGSVLIRQGRGAKAKELRGDRLFYDLRRKRGVIRRAEVGNSGQLARQEFIGNDFALLPAPETPDAPAASAPVGNSASGSASPPVTPSPYLRLENETTRGSTFVAPQALPTAPESATKETGSALFSPLGGVAPAKSASEPSGAAPAEAPSETASETAANGASNSASNAPGIVSGSLADTPQAPQGQELRGTARVEVPRSGGARGEINGAPDLPAYAPLPTDEGPTPRIVEVPPPAVQVERGYWVAARRLRVFPRDKVQFERASIFFNGQKAYGVPLYVLPLDGSFNPTTDLVSFNSQGGVKLNVPFYYQASQAGTGAIYLRHEPGSGFSTQRGGLSLALDQQYWLSPRSHGSFSVDQLGRGAWNLNFQHQMQLSPNTSSSFFLNMPRHRDVFARASVVRDLRAMQVGLEAFYDRPNGQQDNLRTQFYARMRPKVIGASGWSYTLGANALAVRRIAQTVRLNSNGSGSGGGVGLPGQGGGNGSGTATRTRPLLGQTLTASLQSPLISPWRGSGFTANLLATAFNYSDGRRGAAPGITAGFSQRLGRADVRLDYTYDRSSLGLYGSASDSFTHYVSGSLSAQLTPKIGIASFLSHSLRDGSTYGSADLSYYFAPQWRAGLFSDYSSFLDSNAFLNYGWSIGRTIGSREVSVNYDANRGRIYLELGNPRF